MKGCSAGGPSSAGASASVEGADAPGTASWLAAAGAGAQTANRAASPIWKKVFMTGGSCPQAVGCQLKRCLQDLAVELDRGAPKADAAGAQQLQRRDHERMLDRENALREGIRIVSGQHRDPRL